MVNLKIMKKNLKLMKILKNRGIIFGLLLISSFSFFISDIKAWIDGYFEIDYSTPYVGFNTTGVYSTMPTLENLIDNIYTNYLSQIPDNYGYLLYLDTQPSNNDSKMYYYARIIIFENNNIEFNFSTYYRNGYSSGLTRLYPNSDINYKQITISDFHNLISVNDFITNLNSDSWSSFSSTYNLANRYPSIFPSGSGSSSLPQTLTFSGNNLLYDTNLKFLFVDRDGYSVNLKVTDINGNSSLYTENDYVRFDYMGVNFNSDLTFKLQERNTHNIYKNNFNIDLVIPNNELTNKKEILFKLSLDNTFNLNNNTFSYQILKYSNHEFLEIGNDENISIEDISLDLDNVINTDENLFNINASYTGVATGFFVITDELIISTESSGSYAYIVFDTQYHLNNFFLSYNALDTSRLLLLPYNSNNELLTNITIENFSFNTYYNSYYLDINDTKVLQSIILPEEVSYFKIGFVANKDNTLSDIRLFSNTGSNVSSAMNLSGKVHFDSNTSYANDYVLRFTIDNSIFKDITLYDNMSYNLWSLIDVSEYKYVTSFNSNSSDTQGELSQIELNITNTLDYNIYDNLIELIPNNYDSITPTLSFVEVYKCNNDIFGNCVKDESTKVNIDKNQYYNSSSIYSNIIFNSKGEYKIVYNFNNTSNATFNIYDLGRTDTLTYKAIPTDFKGYKRINFSGAYDTLLLSSDSSKSFEIFVPSNSIINPNISLIVNSYDYLNNAIVNSYTPMDYLSNSYYSYYELDLDYDNNLVVLLTKLRSSENVIIYVPNDVVTTFGTTKDNIISTPNGNITIDVPPSSEDLIDSTNDFKYFFDYVDSSLESLKEARDTINDLYNYFYDSLPPILKIFHNVALIVLCLVIFIKVGVGQ